MRIALIVAAVLVAIAVPLFLSHRHDNRYEREARRITEAIVAGNMDPVADDFTPTTRAKFTPASVAEASRRFTSIGALQAVRDETKAGADPGAHDVAAVFGHGVVHEHLRYDAGGKIVTFRYDAPVPP